MKIEYRNLFTHFVFTVIHRLPLIEEKYRERIEKYITGIVKNNDCLLYAIYANPEHVHFLISRSPKISEESIASIIAFPKLLSCTKHKITIFMQFIIFQRIFKII